jgi:endoglucanase Acf2
MTKPRPHITNTHISIHAYTNSIFQKKREQQSQRNQIVPSSAQMPTGASLQIPDVSVRLHPSRFHLVHTVNPAHAKKKNRHPSSSVIINADEQVDTERGKQKEAAC